MLAEYVAQFFEEWVATYDGPLDSLEDLLNEWLHVRAIAEVGECYELYLQAISIIIADWFTYPTKYTLAVKSNDKAEVGRIHIQRLSTDECAWRFLERESFQIALFRFKMSYNKVGSRIMP